MKPIQLKAEIISNKQVGPNFWRCEISAAKIAKGALAGQFLNIKVNDTCVPLLRRPLSIHHADDRKLAVLYEALGPGTRALSLKKQGEFLDLIGPLGKGFKIPPAQAGGKNVLVAGGLGVAPLLFLSKKLNPAHTSVIIGARTKNHLLCAGEFKKRGFQTHITTDDGSAGLKGQVTDLLAKMISKINRLNIYACGPKKMLQAVAEISVKNKFNAQLSLETHMACGIGACLGCVVNTTKGFKRVCSDGPVFQADELIR